MKILYLLVGSLFCLCADIQAGKWMSETDIAKVNAGQSGAKAYWQKGPCGLSCFEVEGKDLRRNSVQNVREGFWESAVSLEDCADPTDCSQKQLAKTCPGPEFTSFHGDIDGDEDLEVWCTRRALVKKIKADIALALAADANDATLNTKNAELLDAKTKLRQALPNWGTITDAQLKQVVKHLVRRHLRE